MHDDDFPGGTSPTDVSIDAANSKEVMVGSHIVEQQNPCHKKNRVGKKIKVKPRFCWHYYNMTWAFGTNFFSDIVRKQSLETQ